MHATRFLAVGALVAGATIGVAPRAQAAPRSVAHAVPNAAKAHHPDFNHDGYADLVVIAQGDTVAGAIQAGGFWVLYGGAHGANTGGRHKYFTEASIGRGASSGAGDFFGYAYTAGDFNGDGYDDVAVSAVDKDVSGQNAAGGVVVLYGSATGLITSNAQFFTEATSGLGAAPAPGEHFGSSVAAGDFNGDGRDDLAIAANDEKVGGADAGAAFELFGTSHGLSHAAPLTPKEFTETTPGLHGGAKANDLFGWVMQSADFNGDGRDDLAVGAPFKSVDGVTSAGVVYMLPGSASGLTGSGAQTWSENSSGVPDSSENGDAWGETLGAIDINGDGRSELLVGAVHEAQGSTLSVGAVTVLPGSSHGPTATGALFWLLSNTTFGQTPAAADYFGSSFAPFDFDGDGRLDLAIGVEGRTFEGNASAGEVVVLHNVGGRLSRSGGFTFTRAVSNAGEYFGALVRGGDWSGNGRDDLAVSVPYLVVSGHNGAGGMQVSYGTSSGVANPQLFTANSLGGTPYTNAYLGGYDY